MPTYMASGGHYFGQTRYRFLILPRYDFDLHSIIRSRQVETKNILIIASQLIDILEHIHDCGYAHSDIKAENIMIGKCTYKKSKDIEQKNRNMNAMSQQHQKQLAKKSVDKRKPVRKLRMTLACNDSDTRQAKRTAKSKSYAESSSSASSNKSEDSDFGDDFDKLSEDDDDDDDEDDDDEEDENEDDEIDNDIDDDDDDVISNSGKFKKKRFFGKLFKFCNCFNFPSNYLFKNKF